MKLVNKLGPCRGYVLFSLFGWTVELWRIAPKYTVPKHSHTNIDNWIIYLFGEAMVGKISGKGNPISIWLDSTQRFRKMHIAPSEIHWIVGSDKPLWLLTVQHWIDPSSKPISVSENITYET